MGGGSYSTVSKSTRDFDSGLHKKSIDEVFSRRSLDNEMDPKNVSMRESRDSDEHPNSLPIVIGLDVTGSMGEIPNQLVRKGLPKIVSSIIEYGEPDPQILFLGIGDHKVDSSPLQVGQFESSDELLDKWLTQVYLEGGGGGNGGESYHLAWYFASHFTSTDSFEKRNKKGFIFTIGDEPVFDSLPNLAIERLMGGDYPRLEDESTVNLLKMARSTYNVFHVHVKNTWNGRSQHVIDGWKKLLGENLIIVEGIEDIAKAISNKVVEISRTFGERTSPSDLDIYEDELIDVEKPNSSLDIELPDML